MFDPSSVGNLKNHFRAGGYFVFYSTGPVKIFVLRGWYVLHLQGSEECKHVLKMFCYTRSLIMLAAKGKRTVNATLRRAPAQPRNGNLNKE